LTKKEKERRKTEERGEGKRHDDEIPIEADEGRKSRNVLGVEKEKGEKGREDAVRKGKSCAVLVKDKKKGSVPSLRRGSGSLGGKWGGGVPPSNQHLLAA